MVMSIVIFGDAVVESIKASEFKARCLSLLDEVARTGKPLLVTKNGKPVAELVPHRPASGEALGAWSDQVRITGDIVSPLDTDWDVLK
jgi:prevent-host-death family protein